MNTNMNIYFNRQCQKHKLIPKYININTNNKNMTAQKTIKQAQRLWTVSYTHLDVYKRQS